LPVDAQFLPLRNVEKYPPACFTLPHLTVYGCALARFFGAAHRSAGATGRASWQKTNKVTACVYGDCVPVEFVLRV
jgi:hypothetical protein